jgi:hypothetical protein
MAMHRPDQTPSAFDGDRGRRQDTPPADVHGMLSRWGKDSGFLKRSEEPSMKNRIATLSLALALGASGAVMAQQQAMTEPQVQTHLTEQGYTKVSNLKFEDGMWQAHAKSANGKSVDLRIDAKTGQIYPDKQVSKLTKHDIRASLADQSYTDVHDVEFDDGIWKAKAKNPSGSPVKLKIDANSGKVIGTE